MLLMFTYVLSKIRTEKYYTRGKTNMKELKKNKNNQTFSFFTLIPSSSLPCAYKLCCSRSLITMIVFCSRERDKEINALTFLSDNNNFKKQRAFRI